MRGCPNGSGPLSEQLLRCCAQASGSQTGRLAAFCEALRDFSGACQEAGDACFFVRRAREAAVYPLVLGGAFLGAVVGGAVGFVGGPAAQVLRFLQDKPSALDGHLYCPPTGGECYWYSQGLNLQSAKGSAAVGGVFGAAAVASLAYDWAHEKFIRPSLGVPQPSTLAGAVTWAADRLVP